MKSATLLSFWAAYELLNEDVKHSARKAYRLWAQNPFHPSLHFKCINREESVWSVRITRGYRALGILVRALARTSERTKASFLFARHTTSHSPLFDENVDLRTFIYLSE